jgi:ArsR family transcriptional regulator
MHLLDTRSAVAALKAVAEPTRLRILALLAEHELSVSDLTRVLGQSQPRVSRHLKLLADAGLIDRFREGSWVHVHVSERLGAGRLGRLIAEALDGADPTLARDRCIADQMIAERQDAAQAYFRDHAAEWDRIRAQHLDEARIEAAILRLLGKRRARLLVDLGTGTGRMLEVAAELCERGIGIDTNMSMLAYARSRLQRQGLANLQVRQADIYDVPLDDGQADLVIMHQVLHFLSDPARAVAEAARIVAPAGRLLIVDFAPHELEVLRDRFQHQRLGFQDQHIRDWLRQAGLDECISVEVPPPAQDGSDLVVRLWLASRTSQTDVRDMSSEADKSLAGGIR